MKNYIKKLLNLVFFLGVLLGIPYLAGEWNWMFLSWIPAALTFLYLDN